MPKTKKINVIVFAGGSGTNSILKYLKKIDLFEIKLLINGYDDGLSTGYLRSKIKNFLGPSDFRKNCSVLLNDDNDTDVELKKIIDFRFDKEVNNNKIIKGLKEIISTKISSDNFIYKNFKNLNLEKYLLLKESLENFILYIENKKIDFEFSDCSLGNIFIAGFYIKNKYNFNKAIDDLNLLINSRHKIINVTDGTNLFLSAILEDGTFLDNESKIVSYDGNNYIKEIFLSSDKIQDLNVKKINTFEEKINYLRSKQLNPKINSKLKNLIEDSDLIIYGPGTQSSSLLPSYLTSGIKDAILNSKKAKKIFIANIQHDNDIRNLSVSDLISNFNFYINNKKNINNNKINDFIDIIYNQEVDTNNLNRKSEGSYIETNIDQQNEIYKLLQNSDWESRDGKHDGENIVNNIISYVNYHLETNINQFYNLVSIIVPCYNEKFKISRVLNNLNNFDLSKLNLSKEIIVIDNNSNDGSDQIIKKFKDIKFYQNSFNQGRGSAYRLGIQKSKGNIIIFFPSDDEYDVNCIYDLLNPIVKNDYEVVYGSRNIKFYDYNSKIKDIYKKNFLLYFLSKYGGMVISIMMLFLYKKFITDPFSTVKGFKKSVFKNITLISNGVDLEIELVSKLTKNKKYIYEIPVNYTPRTKSEGKKTNFIDGLKCIYSIIKFKLIS